MEVLDLQVPEPGNGLDRGGKVPCGVLLVVNKGLGGLFNLCLGVEGGDLPIDVDEVGINFIVEVSPLLGCDSHDIGLGKGWEVEGSHGGLCWGVVGCGSVEVEVLVD